MLLRTSDAELFYKTQGKGPDIVLLHPFPSCHEFWTPVQDKLAAKYRLIMPDLRGLGESGAGDGNATMQKHADDLMKLCDELKVAKAVFIGCSIGGYILFECWRRFRERIAGLVLANTKASADNAEARAARLQAAEQVLQQGPEQYVDSMLPKLLGEITQRNRPDVVEKAKRTMMRSTAQGIAAVQRGMAERPDSTPTLSNISVPTLILGGAGDLLSPREELERMRSGIRNSTLQIVPKAGHYAAFEQPEEVAILLKRFLEQRAK
jgi:pimeloyl-ACP methyl ester carboxylesterase